MRGNVIAADEARRIGLITHVIASGQIEQKKEEIISDLKRGSLSAQRMAKRMSIALSGMPQSSALAYASTMNALARQTDECKQGVARFLEKHSAKAAR